jgi:hypothetical protein
MTTRRDFLKALPLPLATVAPPLMQSGCAPPVTPRVPEVAHALADVLLAAEATEVVPALIDRIAGGLAPRTLNAAVAIACVRGLDPLSLDGTMHVHYANETALTLAASSSRTRSSTRVTTSTRSRTSAWGARMQSSSRARSRVVWRGRTIDRASMRTWRAWPRSTQPRSWPGPTGATPTSPRSSPC